MIKTINQGLTMWAVENQSNGQIAKIFKRHEYNIKTGGYGRFHVEKNGYPIKPYAGTAFDSFSEAEAAAQNSVR